MKKLLSVILFIASCALADDVVRRGAAIPPDAKLIPLTNVLANPGQYAHQTIVTEGVVEKVCWIAGCWMNVAPAAGKSGMHVTFRNGAFAVPRDSRGRKVRLLGTVKGSGKGVSFVATGVELTP